MAHLDDPTIVLDPVERPWSVRTAVPAAVGPVRGFERVAREHVLDVHQEQLLVLLLVVEPELDERGCLGRDAVPEGIDHRAVDVLTVRGDLEMPRT